MKKMGVLGACLALVAAALVGCEASGATDAATASSTASSTAAGGYGIVAAQVMDDLGCTEREEAAPQVVGVDVLSVGRCRYESRTIEVVTFADEGQMRSVADATQRLIDEGSVGPGSYFYAEAPGWRIQDVDGYGREALDAAVLIVGGSVGVFEVAAASTPDAAPAAPPSDLTTSGKVTKVVDGDTIDVGGERIRVIGIDTPERGQCGFGPASSAMAKLVLGKRVVLTSVDSKDNRDKYDRLLRYVDVAGVDAGLSLIRQGLATARYDSRDGYGAHPREDQYVTTDAEVPNIRCASSAAPKAVAPAPAKKSGNCDPSYPGVCIPPAPPDLDCGEITQRRFVVRAPDPHGFDGDNDGVGCESG